MDEENQKVHFCMEIRNAKDFTESDILSNADSFGRQKHPCRIETGDLDAVDFCNAISANRSCERAACSHTRVQDQSASIAEQVARKGSNYHFK
jgi:hypothetical protein